MTISAKKISEGYPDRIRQAEAAIESSLAEMAERAGISTPTIYRWLNGERKPKPETLAKLATTNGIEPRWLLTGDGEMLSTHGDGEPNSRGLTLVKSEGDDAERVSFVEVPVFGEASAGSGRVATLDIQRYVSVPVGAFQQEFRRTAPQGKRSKRLGYFEVRGDSAAPSYFDGELVPVELVENSPEQRFNNDNVYVFRWEDMTLLKRLRREPGRRIVASSLNPSITPFHFTPSENDFEVLARVIEGVKQQLYTSLIGRLLHLPQEPLRP